MIVNRGVLGATFALGSLTSALAVFALHPLAAGAASSDRSSISLTATDPQYSYAIQVGDAITMNATVRDSKEREPNGTVSITSNNNYDKGCPSIHLKHRTKATCYITFYSPGRFSVKATYDGRDGSVASVTLHITVVPSTND
jgi:hypothetical protein